MSASLSRSELKERSEADTHFGFIAYQQMSLHPEDSIPVLSCEETKEAGPASEDLPNDGYWIESFRSSRSISTAPFFVTRDANDSEYREDE
jgi:hypothetical protein